MCADQNHLPNSIPNCRKNGQSDPICVAVNIDINDIYDGALKVLKSIKPFWPINNVQFKVGTKNLYSFSLIQLVLCVYERKKIVQFATNHTSVKFVAIFSCIYFDLNVLFKSKCTFLMLLNDWPPK